MLYLIDNPVVREAFFPTGTQPLSVEPAEPRDAPVVMAIAREHEGPAAAALIERWQQDVPEMFSVVRERDDRVAGFFMLVDGGMLHPSLVAGDPVLEAWTRDLHDRPLPKGQLALGLRRWLDAERGERPCASQAACWLDVKRTYMALRPALRRMYVVVRDVPGYWPVVERLGFRPFANSVATLDGHEYSSVVLDFGPGSVDGWLAALVADELGVGGGDELDEDALELTVHGVQVALTRLEFGLFRHLREREGRSVSRGELLHEVWHTDFTGGSNVVDAVVRSLRHKLGDEARRSSRPCAAAAIACGPTGARTSTRSFIEVSSSGSGDALTVAAMTARRRIPIITGLVLTGRARPVRHRRGRPRRSHRPVQRAEAPPSPSTSTTTPRT